MCGGPQCPSTVNLAVVSVSPVSFCFDVCFWPSCYLFLLLICYCSCLCKNRDTNNNTNKNSWTQIKTVELNMKIHYAKLFTEMLGIKIMSPLKSKWTRGPDFNLWICMKPSSSVSVTPGFISAVKDSAVSEKLFTLKGCHYRHTLPQCLSGFVWFGYCPWLLSRGRL